MAGGAALAMTSSTLAIIILTATVALFVTNMYAKRNANNQSLQIFVRVLSVVILILAAFYFYMRFAG